MPLNKLDNSKNLNLRFPEFNSEYKLINLKEISTLSIGRDHFSRKDMDNKIGSIECIHYGDLSTSLNIINNLSFSKTNFEGKVFTKKNDLLISIALSGNKSSFKWISIKKKGILLSQLISVFSIKDEFDSDYISLILNSKKYTKKIQSLVQGTIASQLFPKDLKKISFSVSEDKNEQNKIVYFYKQLLILIEKNEKLIEKLKIKNAFLIESLLSNSLKSNKEFKPLYRFKNFFGDYQKVDLSQISQFSKGQGIFPKKFIDNINGVYDCIHYGDVNTKLLPIKNTNYSKTNLNNGILSDKNDLIISRKKSGRSGSFKWVSIQINGIIIFEEIYIFKINNSFNSDYLSLVLNSKSNQMKVYKISSGSIAVNIRPKYLSKVSFFISSNKNEQNKIVDFYTLLERKLEAANESLLKRKELLKFLSNNMF